MYKIKYFNFDLHMVLITKKTKYELIKFEATTIDVSDITVDRYDESIDLVNI